MAKMHLTGVEASLLVPPEIFSSMGHVAEPATSSRASRRFSFATGSEFASAARAAYGAGVWCCFFFGRLGTDERIKVRSAERENKSLNQGLLEILEIGFFVPITMDFRWRTEVHLYEHIHEHHHFVYRAPPELPPQEAAQEAAAHPERTKRPKKEQLARPQRPQRPERKESDEAEMVIPRIVVEQVPDRPASESQECSPGRFLEGWGEFWMLHLDALGTPWNIIIIDHHRL